MAWLETGLVTGSTVRWTLRARKSGVDWLITSATLYLISPGGTQTSYAMTVTSGVGTYTVASTVLTSAGVWLLWVEASDGSATGRSTAIRVKVNAAGKLPIV